MGRSSKKYQESFSSRSQMTSYENRETDLISLAYDLAEQRLRNKTATSQEVTHFLKVAANREKERLESEILSKKIELLTAQTEALKSAKAAEEMYSNAMSAFALYRGEAGNEKDER